MQNILQIGDKVDVIHIDNTGKVVSSDRIYASQLLDFIDDKTISISMPLFNGLVMMLNPGEKYRLSFYTAKGLYQCSCIMLSHYREDSALIAALKITSALDKVQRRQYYRLECILDIEYRLVTAVEIKLIDALAQNRFGNSEERAEARRILSKLDNTWLKASITDLSGGGARFNSDEPLSPGDKVKIKLNFITGKELKKLILGADIVASEKLLNLSGKYEHRAEFTDIGKADREDLIKYVFEQERKRRKNQSI